MKAALPGLLMVLALLGAGCLTDDIRQAYPGAPLPADETCTLFVPAMLDVRSIDGVPMDWSMRIKRGKMQELSLLPGNHRLLIRYYDPTADESRQEIYEVDRIELSLAANPKSVQELKYDTWTHNAALRQAREKVRVWVEQISPGVPMAPRTTFSARAAAMAPGASDGPVTGTARMDAMKNNWQSLTPAEREAYLKWLLAQP